MRFFDHIFHPAAVVASNGVELGCLGFSTLTIEITSSVANVSRTITFYGKSSSGVLRAIPGCKMSGDTNFTMALSTTGTGEIWQFDVTGLETVVMDLTAINAGTVTVKGRLTV